MKKHIIILITILSCVGLNSCFKDPETILTNNFEFVSVSGGELHSDTGLVYLVSEDNSDKKWTSFSRIFIHNDILRLTESGAYEIRLIEYVPVEVKSIRRLSDVGEDNLGKDPICLYQAWGFNPLTKELNLSYAFSYEMASSFNHTTDMIFDDVRSAGNDTVFFKLTHDGHGEVLKENEKTATIGLGYSTFYLLDAFAGRSGNVPAVFEFDWYKNDASGNPIPETEHVTVETTFTVY